MVVFWIVFYLLAWIALLAIRSFHTNVHEFTEKKQLSNMHLLLNQKHFIVHTFWVKKYFCKLSYDRR